MIGLPWTRRRRFAATSSCPGWGRSALSAASHAAVEQVQKEIDGLGSHAGPSDRERVRAQEEDRADDIVRQRLAHPGGVAPQQVQLERRQVGALDPYA